MSPKKSPEMIREELDGIFARASSKLRASSHRLLREEVDEVLKDSLSPRERRVLGLRFGLEDGRSRTQAQVGREIGRSRWTAGRVEREALRKLHDPSNAQRLRDYLS